MCAAFVAILPLSRKVHGPATVVSNTAGTMNFHERELTDTDTVISILTTGTSVGSTTFTTTFTNSDPTACSRALPRDLDL